MSTNPFDTIIDAALQAADEATAAYIAENGEHPFNCGFAWVVITPARGKLVERLKARDLGRKPQGMAGFQVWNPSKNWTQDMSAKKAGADAFAAVLLKNGVKCYADCRLD